MVLDGDYSALNETVLTPLLEEWLLGAFPGSSLAVEGYSPGSIVADVEGDVAVTADDQPDDYSEVGALVNATLSGYVEINGTVGGYTIESTTPVEVTSGPVGTTTSTTTTYSSPDSDSDKLSPLTVALVCVAAAIVLIPAVIFIVRKCTDD